MARIPGEASESAIASRRRATASATLTYSAPRRHAAVRLVTVAGQDGRLETIEALARNAPQVLDETSKTVDIAEQRACAHDRAAGEPTGDEIAHLAGDHGSERLIKTFESIGCPAQ